MDADDLRNQVSNIITAIRTAQVNFRIADTQFSEVLQELLALDAGGSKSMHVITMNRLMPGIAQRLEQLAFDLALVESEAIMYRNKL